MSVTVKWEAGTLHLMIVNTVANRGDRHGYTPGFGLTDLARRLRQAGGILSHELSGGRFRLCAGLPASGLSRARKPRLRKGRERTALGFAVGVLLLVILPAAVMIGVR